MSGTTPALVTSLENKNRDDNESCYRGTPRLFGRISYGRTAPPQCKRKSPLTCTAAMAPLLMALVLMHGAYVGAAVPLRGLWWWRDATVRAGKGVVNRVDIMLEIVVSVTWQHIYSMYVYN